MFRYDISLSFVVYIFKYFNIVWTNQKQGHCVLLYGTVTSVNAVEYVYWKVLYAFTHWSATCMVPNFVFILNFVLCSPIDFIVILIIKHAWILMFWCWKQTIKHNTPIDSFAVRMRNTPKSYRVVLLEFRVKIFYSLKRWLTLALWTTVLTGLTVGKLVKTGCLHTDNLCNLPFRQILVFRYSMK